MTATPELTGIDAAALTANLKTQVLALEDDLRERLAEDSERDQAWRDEHRSALEAGRTAMSWVAFRDDRITQVAVAWVLTTVFIRFCEDNALVEPVWIAGPSHRRQEALDAQLDYFRRYPEDTDREWLLQAIEHLGSLQATAGLVDDYSPIWQLSPSGNAVTALLAFWRRTDDDEGRLVHDLTSPTLSTRFLGDLYQDLSEYARSTFALLQTPVFVEEFILDQTLEPAMAERPLEGFTLIDPTCGSGHFLLGTFERLLERWRAEGVDDATAAHRALESVHGVDLNPFAVAIARFRLTVEAMHAVGLSSLTKAPKFRLNLAVGDSLLHGGQGQLNLGLNDDAGVSGFTYSTENLEKLGRILTPGAYDVVVGNPPYITVKDKTLNQEYRRRYATTKGTYAMTVPFMERFFELAKRGRSDQPAGWTGQITSNSFMKREFGSKLIEEFLVKQDLRLVADTSGAYIPGHGTPTVIIVGRNRRPETETVRAVLGIRGEPGRPADAAQGLVWRSIADHVDQPGYEDEWVTVTDLDRSALAAHPWSLTGGGAVELAARLGENSAVRLSEKVDSVGFMVVTREDDAYLLGRPMLERRGVSTELRRPLSIGSGLRDWSTSSEMALCTYDGSGVPKIDESARRLLWPYKAPLLVRRALSGTQLEQGLEWWEYSQLNKKRFTSPLLIAFAFVSTHNHFTLDRAGRLFIRSAPVIKLPEGASEDDHLALLGVLNSSTACFWLKQNSHNKASAFTPSGMMDQPWSWNYEFTGTTLQDMP